MIRFSPLYALVIMLGLACATAPSEPPPSEAALRLRKAIFGEAIERIFSSIETRDTVHFFGGYDPSLRVLLVLDEDASALTQPYVGFRAIAGKREVEWDWLEPRLSPDGSYVVGVGLGDTPEHITDTPVIVTLELWRDSGPPRPWPIGSALVVYSVSMVDGALELGFRGITDF